MHVHLTINDRHDEDLLEISLGTMKKRLPDRCSTCFTRLDPSSTISSWLIDHYFTSIYSQQVKSSKQSMQPNNIIGLHDMFIVYQIVHSSSASEFAELCKKKCHGIENDSSVESYNGYLSRCGLKDIIDLFHQCALKSCVKTIRFNVQNMNSDIDRLFADYLMEAAVIHAVYDVEKQTSCTETRENVAKLLEGEVKAVEPTISKVSP